MICVSSWTFLRRSWGGIHWIPVRQANRESFLIASPLLSPLPSLSPLHSTLRSPLSSLPSPLPIPSAPLPSTLRSPISFLLSALLLLLSGRVDARQRAHIFIETSIWQSGESYIAQNITTNGRRAAPSLLSTATSWTSFKPVQAKSRTTKVGLFLEAFLGSLKPMFWME